MSAATPEIKSKSISGPGGRREGAGRKPGVPNKATAEIKAIAQQYTDKAIKALAQIVESSESDAARVSAANALLDRGWGKAVQGVEVTGEDGGAITVQIIRSAD